MVKMRPLILISNDDGVHAEGLACLLKTVSPLADVVVLAPDTQQSGKSSAVTSGVDIELRCLRKEAGLEVYASNGTPVDCVKLAFYTVCRDRRPDLVLAGINKGTNSSINVIYSGTMGAVIEGCINGIPSVGFSLCVNPGEPADYSYGLPIVRKLVVELLDGALNLPTGVCLNVNFPVGPIEGGLQWCTQAVSKWTKEFDYVGVNKSTDNPLYTLGGEFVCMEPDREGTDEYVLAHHGASCVPLKIDMTDMHFLSAMKRK
ncbi:MAG: 5'/3'-nucleotidase SurE [Paludibacteraceae bacterium]|nr:5'/3'-nucleotidase SurE [Paludibacteraceae bacterium]